MGNDAMSTYESHLMDDGTVFPPVTPTRPCLPGRRRPGARHGAGDDPDGPDHAEEGAGRHPGTGPARQRDGPRPRRAFEAAGCLLGVRLRRSDIDGPGSGVCDVAVGLATSTPTALPVGAEDRERVKALVIPPAWQDVWISPYPNGHIQAVGTDDAGRRQYLYHDAWHEARGRAKHDRVLVLARKLPAARKQIAADLRSTGLTRKRVTAAGLRMLDAGLFRSGGEEYEAEHGSHGVATLLRSHVTVSGEDVTLRVPREVRGHRARRS